MTDARAERVVARNPIVRSDRVVKRMLRASHAPSGRAYKTKNFLTNPFSAGGVGGAAKKMKGNFMVLFPPLHHVEIIWQFGILRNGIQDTNICLERYTKKNIKKL